MFSCCCSPSEGETEIKPMSNMDEQNGGGGMNEEDVPVPGYPTAAGASKSKGAEPSLGRIEEEGDSGAPQAQSPGKGETFLVTLKRPVTQNQVVDSLFGVMLFYSDATTSLEIIDVDRENSSVMAYNKSAQKGRELLPGMLILAVNGVAESVTEMLTAWKETTEVNCVVCIPVEFPIQVIRVEGGMGIDVTHSSKGTGLLIEGIQAGPVQKWNRAEPDKQVQVGDRIVSVDGVRGSPVELKGALKNATGKIKLVMARRP